MAEFTYEQVKAYADKENKNWDWFFGRAFSPNIPKELEKSYQDARTSWNNFYYENFNKSILGVPVQPVAPDLAELDRKITSYSSEREVLITRMRPFESNGFLDTEDLLSTYTPSALVISAAILLLLARRR